jgi:hypothetical protein
MKTILPVKVWYNGNEVEVTILSSNCSDDNLSVSAQFNYQLLQIVPNPSNPYYEYLAPVANGSLFMNGETYQNWETNDYAYDWIAQQLNLTITGEYVPPVPPTPESTSTTTTTTEVPESTTTTTSTTSAPSTTSTTSTVQ